MKRKRSDRKRSGTEVIAGLGISHNLPKFHTVHETSRLGLDTDDLFGLIQYEKMNKSSVNVDKFLSMNAKAAVVEEKATDEAIGTALTHFQKIRFKQTKVLSDQFSRPAISLGSYLASHRTRPDIILFYYPNHHKNGNKWKKCVEGG
ncbi:MAG: hypothetical protein WCO09_04245, partial [bacterium]